MIRVATIGTSSITERFASAVAEVDGIRVDVVFSRSAERGTAFADRIGAPRASDDLDALLAYENATGRRPPFLTMLDNRITSARAR